MFCFVCGANLEIVDQGLRCMGGEMGLSEKMQELLEGALLQPRSNPTIAAGSRSSFRCPRCTTLLTYVRQRELQCSACGLLLSPEITYQMIDRHQHAENSKGLAWKESYHCWRCAVAFKPTADSNFYGPFYCPSCLNGHPELFEHQRSNQRAFEPDITARIRLFQRNEGGRGVPCFRQIRAPMKIEGKDDAYHDCVVRLPEAREFHAGETFVADIQFLCPDLVKEWLKDGMRFKLWELRFIAEGEVIATENQKQDR